MDADADGIRTKTKIMSPPFALGNITKTEDVSVYFLNWTVRNILIIKLLGFAQSFDLCLLQLKQTHFATSS